MSDESQQVSLVDSWVKLDRKGVSVRREEGGAEDKGACGDSMSRQQEVDARNEQVVIEVTDVLRAAAGVLDETMGLLSSLRVKQEEELKRVEDVEEASEADEFASLTSSRDDEAGGDEPIMNGASNEDDEEEEGEEEGGETGGGRGGLNNRIRTQAVDVEKLRYELKEMQTEVEIAQQNLIQLRTTMELERDRQEQEKEEKEKELPESDNKEEEKELRFTSQLTLAQEQAAGLEAAGKEISLLLDILLAENKRRREEGGRMAEELSETGRSLQVEKKNRRYLEKSYQVQLQELEETIRVLSEENKSLQRELSIEKQVYTEQVR